MRKPLLLLPLGIVIMMGVIFFQSLRTPDDPFASVLLNKPVPVFNLPAIPTASSTPMPPGLASKDLYGQVSLVNVFASWCVSCRVEHPLLMKLAQQGDIPLMGLNWKDKPGDGAAWLMRLGNPYTRIGDDNKGRTAIDFGVTGAPETYVIDHKGRVRYKHVGPIMPQDWEETLAPLIAKLRAEQNG